MHLPLSYPIRNLTRRPWSVAMTILGIGVVVFAATVMLALSRGLYHRLDVTGESANVLIISRKGQNVMFSDIKDKELNSVRSMAGLAADSEGRLLVSPELMHVSFMEVGGVRESVSIRGVRPVAYDVHRLRLLSGGRLPERGSFELLVGCAAHMKLGVAPEALALGETVEFEGREWTVSGTFTAGGGLTESEVWTCEEDLWSVLRRQTHSFVVARFQSPAAAKAATADFDDPDRLKSTFKGWVEKEYYAEFSKAMGWVYALSLFMVGAITVAGALIGVNTMYTAIITRMDEFATLRVFGFKGRHIVAALLVESILISLLGVAVGVGVAFLVNNSPVRLSQGAFVLTIDSVVVAAAAGLGLFIGVVGALLPAIKPLRLTILEALHHE